MIYNAFDVDSRVDIAIKHFADQVNAIFAHYIRNAELAVHNLVNAVEWILFVDDGIEENTKCPYILFLTTIRFASKDFGSSII